MGFTRMMEVSLRKGIKMFSLNDKVVYPGHGVASICRVFEKNIGSRIIIFYELKFQNKDMTIMVPQDKVQEVGVRSLSSADSITVMLSTLAQPARHIKSTESTASNWNKRNKEYQSKLRTGSLKDISEIYRDLKYIAKHKELSFGEKNLLLKTEALLVEEISAAQQLGEDKVIEKLRSYLVPSMVITPHSTIIER